MRLYERFVASDLVSAFEDLTRYKQGECKDLMPLAMFGTSLYLVWSVSQDIPTDHAALFVIA